MFQVLPSGISHLSDEHADHYAFMHLRRPDGDAHRNQ